MGAFFVNARVQSRSPANCLHSRRRAGVKRRIIADRLSLVDPDFRGRQLSAIRRQRAKERSPDPGEDHGGGKKQQTAKFTRGRPHRQQQLAALLRPASMCVCVTFSSLCLLCRGPVVKAPLTSPPRCWSLSLLYCCCRRHRCCSCWSLSLSLLGVVPSVSRVTPHKKHLYYLCFCRTTHERRRAAHARILPVSLPLTSFPRKLPFISSASSLLYPVRNYLRNLSEPRRNEKKQTDRVHTRTHTSSYTDTQCASASSHDTAQLNERRVVRERAYIHESAKKIIISRDG